MTIGILGCNFGTGATHLAIALCNYCASKQKKKCAYLELHSRNDISHLFTEAKPYTSDAVSRPRIRFRGVDYYPAVRIDEVPTLLNRGYDCLVLDAGTSEEGMVSEFLRCDRKLILGSLAPWKSWKYEAFFQKFTDDINLGEGFDYLVQTGSAKELASFSKTHHINMQVVPFIKDPFHIEKELFPFLGTLSTEL